MEEYKEIKEFRKQVSENEDTAIKLLKENVLLKSIIKEAREYIKCCGVLPKQIDSFVLLEILDKENK